MSNLTCPINGAMLAITLTLYQQPSLHRAAQHDPSGTSQTLSGSSSSSYLSLRSSDSLEEEAISVSLIDNLFSFN